MSIHRNLDFACIGAQKAGTTTLHDLFKQHPEITLPEEKEANFFDVNELYAKGRDWFYEEYFNKKELSESKKLGIINPNLSMNVSYVERLLQDNPEIKIIYIIRNPLERAYSHYKMSKRRGIESLGFEEALLAEERRLNFPSIHKNYYSEEPGHFEKNHFSYFFRSNYSIIIDFLKERLPPDRILFLQFEEELIKNPEKMINKICSFLDIKEISLNTTIKSNEATVPKSSVVRNIIFGPSIAKSILKKSINNAKFRRKMKNHLISWNSKRDDKTEQLTPAEKQVIFEKYFKEITEKFRNLLNEDI